MSSNESFHMIVEDVFSIRGRGTVATGKIESGTLKVGDELVIRRKSGDKTATVTGIETFRKAVTEAQAGQTVGILLKDVDREDVQRGDEILGPGGLDFSWKP